MALQCRSPIAFLRHRGGDVAIWLMDGRGRRQQDVWEIGKIKSLFGPSVKEALGGCHGFLEGIAIPIVTTPTQPSTGLPRYGPTANQTVLGALPKDLQTILREFTLPLTWRSVP